MSEEILFEIREGLVYLTESGRKAHWKVLQDALVAEDVFVSRATIYRAKETGTLVVKFHEAGRGLQRRLPYGYVRLTKAERDQEASVLARRFGVTRDTARKAKRRGWFEPQPSENLTRMTHERIRGLGEYLPVNLSSF